MKRLLTIALAAYPVVLVFGFAPNPPPTTRPSLRLRETKKDLENLAKELNPIIGFYDPIGISNNFFWDLTVDETIGWLRESEIKHGRVAMAACVGYCVQSFYTWPFDNTLSGKPFPSTTLSPPEQWDALPLGAKVQILLFIGFLEFYAELSPPRPGALPHYTKGGIPGKYPSFDGVPHPVPFNLYDPFGFSSKRTKEEKARGLLCEINNGRLAMIGIMSVLCESKIPGSIPALKGLVKPYAGQVMAPFEGTPFFPASDLGCIFEGLCSSS
ncbi:hypothetical protein FisN_17Lh259 [Fistulifera solaris]|uniref:Uncharacterized protein n=1 Tax=Fistulifera solaris TaxID=1519565 RepID=A0A1Z5KN61_FISSO|nr:hypothetical protein FisN_17Lh259 [Fistulifera solaris]|eukprot:GAX27358.1 hypothetical protein FisN_17Lh259 [Fistulifera solaris]